jgi:hypothetical protein
MPWRQVVKSVKFQTETTEVLGTHRCLERLMCGQLDRGAELAAAGIARPLMTNLTSIDEFGHFGGQQAVAAIGTGGRRQIALELHGRILLGLSLNRGAARISNCEILWPRN